LRPAEATLNRLLSRPIEPNAVDAWPNLQDIRRTFPHTDGVKTSSGDTLTVFNIAGNKYRLVTRIRYDYQLINVRAVMTHQEYDEGKWKE